MAPMSVSFEDVVWTLVFLFSVRRGCWLLREWSIARSCARGAARRVPVSERRRRRRGLATEVSPRRPSGRSSPVPYRTGRTVRGVALLSCAVSVRSHWSGVKRLAWCSRGSPVRSRPWPGRARRVGPWALGSARGRRSAPSPAARPRCERAIWHMGKMGSCFCLDCGHEYGE